MHSAIPSAGPSRRPSQEGQRWPIPPLHDGCIMGPEFIYDSEGQPQLFTHGPTNVPQGTGTGSSVEDDDCEEESGYQGGKADSRGRASGRRDRTQTTGSDSTAVSSHPSEPTGTTDPASSTAPGSTSGTVSVPNHTSPRSTPFKRIDRTPTHLQTTPAGRIIWVDFPPGDPANPLCFTKGKKLAIVGVAVYFTGITAYATSSYSIGIPSMCTELGCDRIQGAAGLSLYAWGFGVAPLVLAPLSEEYGRKWSYIIAVVVFTVLHLMMTLGKNTGTILIGRFMIGAAGSLGATLVGGTISDIYPPEERGFPMALFALMAMFFTGLGPVMMSWVEVRPDLGWRWIQWITMSAYIPLVIYVLRETRGPVLIRRRAAKMRKQLAKQRLASATSSSGQVDREKIAEEDEYEYRYTARSEVGKVKFVAAMRTSLLRPLLFLALEPIVTFFSVWISLAWGVFYTQIQGLPYIYPRVYGFSTTQTGLIYITMCIGSLLGFGFNFLQDAIYRRQVAKHGVEARLYAPMAGGVALFIGCMIFAFTVRPDVHWMGPAVAIVIIIASVITLYITGFVYLSECYGSYASSALAAMSFLRNMFGGAFAMFTEDMYDTLTPRWAIFLMGMVAGILGVVPFIAYWKGPEIRARSPFSRILMAEEKARVAAAEQEQKERGRDQSMDGSMTAERDVEAQAETGHAGAGRGDAGSGAMAEKNSAAEQGELGELRGTGRIGRMARRLTGTSTTEEHAPPPMDRLTTGLQGRGEWDEEVREKGQAQLGFEKASGNDRS